jgi:hypothetical protein
VRELIAAAAELIVARRRPVLVVLGAVMLPAMLLEKVPPTVGGPADVLGSVIYLVATTLLVAVFLAGLRGLGPKTIDAGSVLTATIRAFVAFVIAEVPILPIMLFVLGVMRSQPAVVRDLALDAVVAPWFAVIAPVLLATPVCLSERGGPWWSLKRAWSLSRPRRGQVRLLLMGLELTGLALGLLTHLPGPLSLATLITAPAIAVAQAALLAVLYVRLVAEEPPAPALLPVRSRQQAAAGTFRTTNRRNAAPRRNRR